MNGKIFSFSNEWPEKIVGERERECVRRRGAEGAWPCGEVGVGVGKKREEAKERRQSKYACNVW